MRGPFKLASENTDYEILELNALLERAEASELEATDLRERVARLEAQVTFEKRRADKAEARADKLYEMLGSEID